VSDAARVESKDTLKANQFIGERSDASQADIWVNAKFISAKANDAGGITFGGSGRFLGCKSVRCFRM